MLLPHRPAQDDQEQKKLGQTIRQQLENMNFDYEITEGACLRSKQASHQSKSNHGAQTKTKTYTVESTVKNFDEHEFGDGDPESLCTFTNKKDKSDIVSSIANNRSTYNQIHFNSKAHRVSSGQQQNATKMEDQTLNLTNFSAGNEELAVQYYSQNEDHMGDFGMNGRNEPSSSHDQE